MDPAGSSAEYICPKILKHWLDEREDFVLLDARNQFEIEVGSFKNSVSLGIAHFRDFEASLKTVPDEWKDRPVVAFCTGGIRCEKAALLLQRHGFKKVYQLEGGILNYFKQVGVQHYEGNCFVFDQRVALDSQLQQA